MKVLVLLLLSLQSYAEGNCGQNKGFTIIENNDSYQLQLCTSTGDCTTKINFTSQDKNRSCNHCKETLKKLVKDCDPTSECIAHTTSSFSDNCCKDSCAPVESALGGMSGLFFVILVLVVTGWVWTCWTMKKKIKETQLCKNCQKNESEEERFCLNQIHTMPTTQPVVGTAIEQLLHSLEESGQSNNGLRRKDNKGHCDVQRVENFYTSSEGSTNSSLQQEQAVYRVEEGESEEKHVYHVLEKPGGDDYEDPDKDLEENTATEYETPLPLKELGLKHASIHTKTS